MTNHHTHTEEVRKTKTKILQIISVATTTYGIGAFILGTVNGSVDFIQIGLLAMILGELVDIEKSV